MISNLLAQYLFNQIINENHPTIDGSRCINNLQLRKSCSTCRDVCPYDVIGYKKDIQWDKCKNCNICVTQCPSKAIRSSSINIEKLLNAYISESRHIVIACKRREGSADLKLYCVASAPWEVIAYLALEKRVTIIKHNCGGCQDQRSLYALDESLLRLKEFFGETQYPERIRLMDDDGLIPEIRMSRREIFSMMKKKVMDLAGTDIPEDVAAEMDGMVYRRLLIHRLTLLKEHDVMRVYGWRTLLFTADCWGCGICAKVCPYHAISVVESNGGTYMSHAFWKCAGCGVCESVCLEKGLSGMRVEYTENHLSPALTAIEFSRCPDCGGPTKPGTGELCMPCAMGKRDNSRKYSTFIHGDQTS